MFKRFIDWVKTITVKTGYVVTHPSIIWKERLEEARARVWAREMAKEAGKTE